MNAPKVIAIAGASGSGKTSVISSLSQQFSCPFLLFDDHTDARTYPENMKLWLQKGADLSEIETPRLVDSLQDLKTKCTAPYIFIEEPFGRCRGSIASLIDYVVLLDVPMEICLSRVIMRNLNNPSNDSLISIPKYLSKYNDHFRDIYINAVAQTRSSSDFIVQQVDTIESSSAEISNWLISMENNELKAQQAI
ncbi:MAG: hypothetical protein ACFHVJ_08600 [Aestuariibacter sp.]